MINAEEIESLLTQLWRDIEGHFKDKQNASYVVKRILVAYTLQKAHKNMQAIQEKVDLVQLGLGLEKVENEETLQQAKALQHTVFSLVEELQEIKLILKEY